jgi:hypothetical protein
VRVTFRGPDAGGESPLAVPAVELGGVPVALVGSCVAPSLCVAEVVVPVAAPLEPLELPEPAVPLVAPSVCVVGPD